jgi:phenylacetate-CoA ligase
MLQAGWQPGDMVAFFWGWNSRLYSMPRIEFEARQWLRRQYQFDSFRAGDEAFTQWVRTWRRIRPKLVYGYASAIARFAEYLISEEVSLPPVRGVFTTAETLLPQQRSAMEQAFRCKVFDCYGSSEVRNIAAQCAAGGMHVNADFALLEVLHDPRAATDAETGPFAVTSLRSFAMPFIRYQNDDCGALLTETCTCGGGFPLMRLDIARTSDHFLMPNGALVHGLFFIHRLYGSTGVANFQFHQVSQTHIVLYVVRTQPSDGFDESIARAISDINRLSPVPLTIEVREVSSIPLSAAGKHRYVRSDVSHSVPS